MRTFIFLLCFFPLLLLGQNFEFIKTDGTYHFGNKNAYRIDSIIESGAGQLLYSYRMVYDIVNDYEGELDPLATWLGDQVLIDNDGKTSFYNWSNHPFVFYSHYNLNEEWHAFEYENGNYINAKYISEPIWTEIFPNLSDSVKTIGLQVYNSSGQAIDHAFNQYEIRLSKNFGMLDALYYVGIDEQEPGVINNYQITGIDLSNTNYGESYFFKSTVSSLEVNSRMHFISYFEMDENDPHYVSRTVIDKIISEDYCTYMFVDTIMNLEEVSISYDTAKWYISALPYESMFPNDSMNFQGYMELGGVDMAGKWDHNTYFGYHFWQGQNHTYNGEYAWYVDFWELNQGNQYEYRFIENVGYLTVGKGNSWPGDELVYYSNSNEEWGEPFEFLETGINELDNSNFLLSSNPSTGLFRINSALNIDEIKVYNIKGQLVWQSNEQNITEINLEFLMDGLYLLNIQFEDDRLINYKVMINK